MDLISIVVVTYNSSKTILETLESIYNQSYSNLELIIADDHSTDNTVEIIKKWLHLYHERFENIRILRAKRNHGVTKNCNIGLNQARGKFVEILAGDDLLVKEALEKKKQFADKNGINVVFTKVEVFGSNIPRINDVKRYCEKGYHIIKNGWQEQYDQIIMRNFIAGPSGGFYLTKYIQSIGGFDIRYPMLEDYPFIFHYILAGNEIMLLEEELERYRISNSSIATSCNKRFLRSTAKFFFLERFKELIKNKKYKFAVTEAIRYLSIGDKLG